jgi:PAS domain S-box-containing protein
MLDEIINNPDLEKYITPFETGRIIFLEGDDSQDLYILLEGELDILKGNKKIQEITEKGALFGEMSFLLGSARTATVKARSDVKAIKIPKEEITDFLTDFPSVAKKTTEILACRLSETTQILFGLEEFCDQLPDAVILSDKDGRILTWNNAAEKLYGRALHQVCNRPVEEIYEEPEDYKTFIEEVRARYSVREKILKVKHPEKGTRFISTSTTVLYDGQHNFQGVISLGRDVTAVKNLERRYRRARNWLIPSFVLLGLFVLALFYGYPYFSKGHDTAELKRNELRNTLAKDYLLLKSLLTDPSTAKDRKKIDGVMGEFFSLQEGTTLPYAGLILLNSEKKVTHARSIDPEIDLTGMIGSSYSGIEFQGKESSLHSVLTVYRTNKDHPMGYKGIEIAFELRRKGRSLGWLVFQMDTELLVREYGTDEQRLKKFQFDKR